MAVMFSFASAALWFTSAKFKPVYPMGYLSGPPTEIVSRVNLVATLNAWAAATTGISALFQAIAISLN
jgi:hypothetical protein